MESIFYTFLAIVFYSTSILLFLTSVILNHGLRTSNVSKEEFVERKIKAWYAFATALSLIVFGTILFLLRNISMITAIAFLVTQVIIVAVAEIEKKRMKVT